MANRDKEIFGLEDNKGSTQNRESPEHDNNRYFVCCNMAPYSMVENGKDNSEPHSKIS